MNNYNQEGLSSTQSSVLVRVTGPALGAVFFTFAPAALACDITQLQTSPPQTHISDLKSEATQGFSQYSSQILVLPQNFANSMTGFYSTLLNDQEPLGDEFSAILSDNLWDLYES